MIRPLPIEQLNMLAEEKSVRGEIVRLALQRISQIEPARKDVVEEALLLLLDRFDAETGEPR